MASARTRWQMRAQTPWRVRPPWRSSESLAFGRFDDRFDPLADPAEVAVAVGLVFAVGAEEPGGELADDLFELRAGEPFVADDELVTLEGAVVAHPVEERCGDLAFGLVGRRRGRSRCGIPSGGADEVEPEAPEVAAVRGAVAVGGIAGQVGALDRLARLAARNRRRIQQPQPVTERRAATRASRLTSRQICEASARTRLL